MAERRIRELQESGRTMLIHAQRRWPSTVTTNLWPYAVRVRSRSVRRVCTGKLRDVPGESKVIVEH